MQEIDRQEPRTPEPAAAARATTAFRASAWSAALPLMLWLFMTAATALAADQLPADDGGRSRIGIEIGTLTCDIKGGGMGSFFRSTSQAECVFQSKLGDGGLDFYTAEITKLGIDIGHITRARLVWIVVAPVFPSGRGALSGSYLGATVEATVGAGIGAQVLVGASNAIQLQPFSLSSQRGLGFSAAGASLTLTHAY